MARTPCARGMGHVLIKESAGTRAKDKGHDQSASGGRASRNGVRDSPGNLLGSHGNLYPWSQAHCVVMILVIVMGFTALIVMYLTRHDWS